jgi:hypothetical protein
MLLTGLAAGVLAGCLMVWRRTRGLRVLLPADTRPFVASQVAAGQYRGAAEYVRDLIRADEQHKSAPHS